MDIHVVIQAQPEIIAWESFTNSMGLVPRRGEAPTTARSAGAEDQTRRFYLHVSVLFKTDMH
jgi:hypothetical protein